MPPGTSVLSRLLKALPVEDIGAAIHFTLSPKPQLGVSELPTLKHPDYPHTGMPVGIRSNTTYKNKAKHVF